MTHLIKIKKQISGFTLIELIIVVAIIGILSSIAYPNYTRYVQQSKRADAMVALMRAAQMQEKYYSQNLKYAYNEQLLFLGDGSLTDVIESDQGLYIIDVSGKGSSGASCTSAIACTSFTVTATAKSGEAQYRDTDCRKFSLTNTGVKSAEDSTGNAATGCW